MKSVKINPEKSIEENIMALFQAEKPEILHTFHVVPVDYRVRDFLTPRLILTQKHLFHVFDDIIEIFELDKLEIDILGEQPRFTIWLQLLEGTYRYSPERENELRRLRADEMLTRVSIAEPNKVSKDFVVRAGPIVQKRFKTWAMGRILLNTKQGVAPNPILNEMTEGYFSTFNQKTVLNFIWVFLGYFLISPAVQSLLPDIANTVLNVIFVIMLLFLTWWMYQSISKNLKRFENVYLSYKSE